MTDLSILLQALQQAEQQAAKSNPYNTANQVVDSINWNPYQYSTKENLVGGAVKGLLSGLFGGLGDNYQTTQTKQIYGALPGLISGNLQKPEDMDLSVFAPLEKAGTVFSTIKDEERKEAARKYSSDLAAKLAEKRLETTGEAILPDGKVVPIFDPADLKKKQAIAEAQGKIEGEKLGWGANPELHPDSPQSKDKKNRQTEEDSARAEIAKLQSVASLRAADTGLAKIASLKDLDTSTSDIPFIYAFVQGQDGGVVKEGEMQLVQGASPLLKKYEALLNARLNGKSGLTTDIKRQMFNELKQARNSLYKQALTDSKSRLDIAESRGATRDNSSPFNLNEKIIDPDQIKTEYKILLKLTNDPNRAKLEMKKRYPDF